MYAIRSYYDKSALDKNLAAIADVKQKMMFEGIKAKMKIFELLTPDQKKMAVSRMQRS